MSHESDRKQPEPVALTQQAGQARGKNHGKNRGQLLVIGGGICGCTTAAVLARDGWQVTLLDAAGVHDGHLAAALTPVISSDDNVRSRLSRLGAKLAHEFWVGLSGGISGGISDGVGGGVPSDIGAPCGALQLQRPDGAKRVQDLKAQAHAFNQPDWARWVARDDASALAGLDLPRGGIWFAGGWLVKVPKLIAALKVTPHVESINTHVARIEHANDRWLAIDRFGETVAQGDQVVLANAFDALGLLKRSALDEVLGACQRLPALHRLAGEITFLPAKDLGGGPACIVGGDGYVLPAVDGWCVSGGTYVRDAQAAHCTADGCVVNVARARELLGLDARPEHESSVTNVTNLPGWAGWRAVLPGRLPAIGQLPKAKGLWVFTAGASRGLTWSVLGARLIRAGLAQEVGDLDTEMMRAIAP